MGRLWRRGRRHWALVERGVFELSALARFEPLVDELEGVLFDQLLRQVFPNDRLQLVDYGVEGLLFDVVEVFLVVFFGLGHQP